MATSGDDAGFIVKIIGAGTAIIAAIGAPFAFIMNRIDKKASKEAVDKIAKDVARKVDIDLYAEHKAHEDMMHGITHSSLKEIKDAQIKIFDKLDGKQDKNT